jgi:hypothetical protein
VLDPDPEPGAGDPPRDEDARRGELLKEDEKLLCMAVKEEEGRRGVVEGPVTW